MLKHVLDLSHLARDLRWPFSETLPSREAASLLLVASGSANMTESSSGLGERGVEGWGSSELAEKKVESMDVFLTEVEDCASVLLLSSVVKGLSMPMRLVGRLGVHRGRPTGGLAFAASTSGAAIVRGNAQQ